MKVKRLSDARPYAAPNHRDCTALRLVGPDEGSAKLLVGLSHFLPGGGAGPDATPTEKVYTVLSGELTVIVDGQETVLRPMDTCFIGPNETREVVNRGNDVVTMLVTLSAPQP